MAIRDRTGVKGDKAGEKSCLWDERGGRRGEGRGDGVGVEG